MKSIFSQNFIVIISFVECIIKLLYLVNYLSFACLYKYLLNAY